MTHGFRAEFNGIPVIALNTGKTFFTCNDGYWGTGEHPIMEYLVVDYGCQTRPKEVQTNSLKDEPPTEHKYHSRPSSPTKEDQTADTEEQSIVEYGVKICHYVGPAGRKWSGQHVSLALEALDMM